MCKAMGKGSDYQSMAFNRTSMTSAPPLQFNDMTDAEALRALRVVASAMIAGEVIFAAVVGGLYSAGMAPFAPNPALMRPILIILVALAASCLVASILMRRHIFRRARERPTDPLPRDVYGRATIMSFAMNEAYCLAAIVLTMLLDPVFLLIAGVAILAQIAYFPRRSKLMPDYNPYESERIE